MITPHWIFEDDALLVLNKPSGLPSARLPRSPQDQITAVDQAIQHFPAIREVGFGTHEAGLLHRLDTGTSGLLVFAKTQSAFERFRKLWTQQQIRKIYRALTLPLDNPLDLSSIPMEISWPLAHHPKSEKKMICIPPHKEHFKYRGKLLPAETRIVDIRSNRYVDFTIEIKTGVMHQIRCHLAEVGYPILGDSIYGGAPAPRLGLHAWKLEIPSLDLSWEAPLPEDWGG